MKKYFIILVTFLLTAGLTGCYTELATRNAALASDNSYDTTNVYYPMPVADPDPVLPYPVHPQPAYPHPVHPKPNNPQPPVYTTTTPPNSPGKQGGTNKSGNTLRNDNGERGDVPRNTQAAPTRTRTEPSGSSNNSNGSGVSSTNSGNNTTSRTGNTNNNSPRNNNGSRNTNGGR